jgi:hypothetical protein
VIILEESKRVKVGRNPTAMKPALQLSDLDFADDIVLLTNNVVDNQNFLSIVEESAEEICLFIN